MQSLKYDTLNHVRYRIDRRGVLYIDNGKIKRSKEQFYYEVRYSTYGNRWHSPDTRYATRKNAMDYIKSL